MRQRDFQMDFSNNNVLRRDFQWDFLKKIMVRRDFQFPQKRSNFGDGCLKNDPLSRSSWESKSDSHIYMAVHSNINIAVHSHINMAVHSHIDMAVHSHIDMAVTFPFPAISIWESTPIVVLKGSYTCMLSRIKYNSQSKSIFHFL